MSLEFLVLGAFVASTHNFGTIASAGPQVETLVISAETAGVIQVAGAEGAVRTVPKLKTPPKKAALTKEPLPKLSPSVIPSAQNPAQPAPGGDTKLAKPKVPATTGGHCKGSPDCSKLFDGGKG